MHSRAIFKGLGLQGCDSSSKSGFLGRCAGVHLQSQPSKGRNMRVTVSSRLAWSISKFQASWGYPQGPVLEQWGEERRENPLKYKNMYV